MQVEPSHDAEGGTTGFSKEVRKLMGNYYSSDEDEDESGDTEGDQQPGGGKRRFVALVLPASLLTYSSLLRCVLLTSTRSVRDLRKLRRPQPPKSQERYADRACALSFLQLNSSSTLLWVLV
jgi:hypothetical protein